jgi:hypothetical protein
MVAIITGIYFAISVLVNTVLICYCRSQILEIYHKYEGFVTKGEPSSGSHNLTLVLHATCRI